MQYAVKKRCDLTNNYFLLFFSGYVCKRNSVLANGCCDKNSTSSLEFSCNGCKNSTGCCATFEFCVSCCMNPVNVS